MINKIINCAKSIIYNFKNNNSYVNLNVLFVEIKIKKKCDNETYYAKLFDYEYDIFFTVGTESKDKAEVINEAEIFLNKLESED